MRQTKITISCIPFYEKQQKDIYMIALRAEDGHLIGYYEKHEFRNRETMPFYDLW